MLGLTHLAISYYLRCLNTFLDFNRMERDHVIEDFTREAAFALQSLYSANGDFAKAREITEKWLVL